MHDAQQRILVWDRFVRFGHWTLALAFLVAYVTAEELEEVHVWAGYWVGGYVLARSVWGFIGPRHARFGDFVRGPRAILAYLADLARGNPGHYLGHNPAGGAMIVALLLCLGGTVATGLAVEADAENEGPLAPWLGHVAAPARAPTAAVVPREDDSESSVQHKREKPDSVYEEAHELFANLTLGLIVLHLLGVLAGSLAHRENLVRAMITGYKSAAPYKPATAPNRPGRS